MFLLTQSAWNSSENLLPLSIQKNPDLLTFWAGARIFSDLEFMSQTRQRVSPYYDRQTMTSSWEFMSSSTARIIFSLLGEQWWRERKADGDVIVLEVMGVQRPVVAGGFLGVRFSGLRDVVVVGLITCERVVLGKSAKVLISESAQGICPPHRGRWSWWPGGETKRWERR